MEEKPVFEGLMNFMLTYGKGLLEKSGQTADDVTADTWRKFMIALGMKCLLKRDPQVEDWGPVLREIGNKHDLWGEKGLDYLAELGSQLYILRHDAAVDAKNSDIRASAHVMSGLNEVWVNWESMGGGIKA